MLPAILEANLQFGVTGSKGKSWLLGLSMVSVSFHAFTDFHARAASV